MAYTERALRAVDGLGLDPSTMLYVAITIAGYVQATAVNLESEVEAEQDTRVTRDEWMHAQVDAVTPILASGRFPMLAGVAMRPDFHLDLDTLFEFGLKLLLDGLAVRIQHPTP